METVIHTTPVLQSTTRTGKKKYWKGEAFTASGEYYYRKIWWQENSKVQSSTPVLVKGKNIGRANETTARDQALFELQSIETKQRDKGYSEDGSKTHIPTKPMLAHQWAKKSHKVVWPSYVQPKLDGFRMLMDGTNAWTRGGKEHVRECVEHLMWDTKGYTIDGELILPGMLTLQETAKAAKKFRPDVSPTLKYMVYDVVEPGLTFEERYYILQELVLSAPPNVVLVDTILVDDEERLFRVHAHSISHGFEGTIIRNPDGLYDVGHRSTDLIKLKDFQDAEFKIIDVVEGKGSFEGHATFVCETENGKVFNATPEGTMEHRQELYETREDHIGQWLTVRYQSLSNDGVPIFPVGVDIREEDEF